jgi:hypothetical protein
MRFTLLRSRWKPAAGVQPTIESGFGDADAALRKLNDRWAFADCEEAFESAPDDSGPESSLIETQDLHCVRPFRVEPHHIYRPKIRRQKPEYSEFRV